MHQTDDETVNFMITNTLSSSLTYLQIEKKKKYNNLVEDKYLQRLSHFKYFPIESTVV